MIFTTPAEIPFTTPVEELTVAIDALPLLHVPPVTEFARAVVCPTHTVVTPVLAGNVGLTVTIVVLKHPEPDVYVITAVPTPTPVITPLPVIVATAVLPLLQLQPGVAVDSVVDVPRHITTVPDIAAGNGLTVTGLTLRHPLGNV